MTLSFEQARTLILEHVQPLGGETADLLDLVGRVLAAEVRAPWDMPRWDNSEMDGFAVRAADCQSSKSLSVTGFLPAGMSAEGVVVEPGTAVRIMTGAPIPAGCDAVVPIEETESDGSSVTIRGEVISGNFIRRRGSDMTADAMMLPTGTRLRPAEVNLLASFGQAQVQVYRRPEVAILSTGDELVRPGQTPGPGQVVDSNAYSLAAAVQELGAVPKLLGIARDQRSSLAGKISQGLHADMLITTAGVAMGDRDLVCDTLAESGVEPLFWKVGMKPGGPTAFGRYAGKPVFSLPGNPVSSMISFEQLVRPALLKMMGRTDLLRSSVKATLREPMHNRTGKLRFLRVRVEQTADGLVAMSAGAQNTGILSTMIRANAIAMMPADRTLCVAGDQVDVQLLGPEPVPEQPLAESFPISRKTPPAVSFVARSGTGKTTLLEQLINTLQARGHKVGALKMVSKSFEIDHPGKDSYRLSAAGTEATLICSPHKLAFMQPREGCGDVKFLLDRFFAGVDLVLVEGGKQASLPKVEVVRQERNEPLLCCDSERQQDYIAVTSDGPLDLDLPVLDLNNVDEIADFLVARFL